MMHDLQPQSTSTFDYVVVGTGAAGSIVLGAVPAAATNGAPILLGNSTTNDAATTTALTITSGATPAPQNQ